jgi:hypothetical protein
MAKIEKNIPIPEREPRRQKHPWDQLAVGESFVLDNSLINARTYCRQANQRYGKEFTPRLLNGKVRIWRTK